MAWAVRMVCLKCFTAVISSRGADSAGALTLANESNSSRSGFAPDTQTFSVEPGASYGLAAFGSVQAHHLALLSFSYGHMLGGVAGGDHWFRGNFELRGELFTGAQFAPDSEWLVGLTPHLRYDFATGTRIVPFLDAGAGVTATGIGHPDLSNTFEFNLQGGGGMHWFLNDKLALTVEVKYLHFSCAGLSSPNNGLNGVMGLLGLTWIF
ncbi:MAG TPA: acyloxyacyl hydrolase [Candidatus Dormibacteraeota bacterium]|nr:acyloxyacyl hydrolase [Candidatus Dormibacteraeota bacterium]